MAAKLTKYIPGQKITKPKALVDKYVQLFLKQKEKRTKIRELMEEEDETNRQNWKDFGKDFPGTEDFLISFNAIDKAFTVKEKEKMPDVTKMLSAMAKL